MSNKKIISSMDEFLETYILDSSIKEVVYNNETAKWTIVYAYDTDNNEFESTKGMVDFLHADQNQPE